MATDLARWVLGRPGGARRTWLARALRGLADRLRVPAPRPPDTPGADVASPAHTGGVRLVPVAALDAGEPVEAVLAGEPVVVCRVDGEVFVVEALCPHAGGALGDGTLTGATLSCPLHGWTFDVRTGACHVSRSAGLRRFRAWIADGAVVADPEALPPVA